MSPPASRPLCPAFLLVALLALSLPLSAADSPPAKPAPRLDASGDPLPPGAIARLGTARFRHGEAVLSLAYSADGKVFVTSGHGGGVSLWDAATGKELRRLELGKWGARAATLSPDGKRLAVATGFGILHFCDVESGKELWQLEKRLGVHRVAFTPDGRVLFTAGDARTGPAQLVPEINMWETTSGKHLRRFEGAVHAFAVSPDGKRLACGTAGKGLALWDVEGQRLRELKGHQGRVYAVAFARDGRSVVAAAEDKVVRRWDVATSQEAGPALRHERDVTFLAFLPGGKELLTGGHEFACIWDAASGKELRWLRIPISSNVPRFALSPDGKTLAAEWLPLFYDTASGKEIHVRPGAGGAAAISPDGRLAVTSGSGGVRLWDARTGKLLRALQEVDKPLASFGPIAFSPDGKAVLGCSFDSRSAHLWDAATGKELGSFPCRGRIAFTLDGKEFLDFHLPSSLTSRDPASGKPLREVTFQSPPEERGVRTGQRALSRDGRVAVAMREDEDRFLLRDGAGAAYDLWDARTGKHLGALGKLDRDSVRSFSVPALSPDGKLLVVTDSGQAVRLWDASTGRELWRSHPLLRSARALEFSPDGRFLAAGGEDNTAYLLLETATGQEIHCFEGQRGWVGHVAFSPDGRVLASSSDDTTFLWDLTGKALGLSQPAAKELPGLWNALEGDDARRAYQAACRLALSVDGVAFLAKQLRADAPAADGKRLERLLADLDAKTFAARAEASRELAKLGRAAAPALRELLRGQPSLETRRRAETLLAQIEQSAWTSNRLRVRRAVAALERAGTAEGRQALKGLAEGPSGAWLTDEAKAALTRLGHGPR
jgi:WD40 repeat protein